MHKETYKYVKVLSDGTKVSMEKQQWVADIKTPWLPETTMGEILDAYNEFKEMMN